MKVPFLPSSRSFLSSSSKFGKKNDEGKGEKNDEGKGEKKCRKRTEKNGGEKKNLRGEIYITTNLALFTSYEITAKLTESTSQGSHHIKSKKRAMPSSEKPRQANALPHSRLFHLTSSHHAILSPLSPSLSRQE